VILNFALPSVLALAEHALAAPEHLMFDDTPPQPALIWGKDDGTWVRSNGLPVSADAAPVFADIWGPRSGWFLAETVLGGDDFTETLTLTEPLESGTTLIDLLREAHRDGLTAFSAQVSADQVAWFAR